MLARSPSWDQKSFASISSSPSVATRLNYSPSKLPSGPPFGLDTDDHTVSSRASTASVTSQGFREGGPKEARLKRTAFLSLVKDVDHLHPIKVENISPKMSPEKIASALNKYGNVADVYIPISHRTLQPASNFAVVRFSESDAVDRLLTEEAERIPHKIADSDVTIKPLEPQHSFFTRGTGYHGICNIPIDDGTYNRESVQVKQEISLSSCMSRSGYPWGSVRELKFLPPHPPLEAIDGFSLHVQNLPHHLLEEDVQHIFEQYGEVLSVSCPRPILVAMKTNDNNCGTAWVKYTDRRDMEVALAAIEQEKVVVDGHVLMAKSHLPRYWPTEDTRRYY